MKDRQSLMVFFVILGVLFLAGILCYTQLEIVPDTVWEAPSREARTNQYLALERWLVQLGYGVRAVSVGSVETVLQGPEKTVYIENSQFNWADKDQLIPWLFGGGRLIVSLNASSDGRLAEFMETLGGIQEIHRWMYTDDEEQVDDTGEDDGEEKNGGDKEDQYAITKIQPQENPPSFSWATRFKVNRQNIQNDSGLGDSEQGDLCLGDSGLGDRVLVMGDEYGAIKLVKVELGKGWAVFTGEANFLYNFYLDHSENANLAGELFFAQGNQEVLQPAGTGAGILFIRMMSGKRHLLGNLAERGNPLALAVSLTLLVITGFWMAVPVFGRFRPEPERPGKPLRERFLAEGRFLAKYHALGKYIDVYKKELEQQSRSRGIEVILPPTVLSPGFADFIKEQQLLSEQLNHFQN
jgi:hypothetical protein